MTILGLSEHYCYTDFLQKTGKEKNYISFPFPYFYAQSIDFQANYEL
jgi:hypothetical protein